MFPTIPSQIIPEESQEFVLFLQPHLLPYVNGALVTAQRETEPTVEMTNKPSFIVVVKTIVAVLSAVFHDLSIAVARLWQRPGTETEPSRS